MTDQDEESVIISTPCFTFEFDTTAKILSLKNSDGEELLVKGFCKGFYLQEYDKSVRMFDILETLEDNEYLFKMKESNEEVGVKFGGTENYTTIELTKLEGFPLQGETLMFDLRGKERFQVKAMALDYMIMDAPQLPNVRISRPCLWETSSRNPLGKFALYHGLDEDAEDEVLFDLWVNEGLPHPKLEEGEEWDREKAEKWVDDWIELMKDVSMLAICPTTFEEHYEFLPYAQKMDAKIIYMNFRIWSSLEAIDGVSTKMYPNGKEDFLKFANDCGDLGMRIGTHRMSGGLWPHDPYCDPKNINPGIDHWGKMTLAKDIEEGDTTILVEPQEGAQLPIPWKGRGALPPYPYPIIPPGCTFTTFLMGEEWVYAKSIEDLGDGTWEISGFRPGRNTIGLPAGSEVTGYYKGNAFFIPSANSDLLEEVGARYADINNFIQMVNVMFDGNAWHKMEGHWAFVKFSSFVYQNLDHPTTNQVWPWIENRFNRAKKIYGSSFAGAFSASAFLGNKSRSSVSVEEIAYQLHQALYSNCRGISLAHGILQSLDVFKTMGNIDEILTMVKDYKVAAMSLNEEERRAFDTSRRLEKPKFHLSGKAVVSALWWLEGSTASKWYSTGTDIYNHEYYNGPEHGPIQPRFYLQNGYEETLFIPDEISSGFEKVRVVGRLLPRFEPESENNINLLEKMGVEEEVLEISESNDTEDESFSEGRLKAYPIERIDMLHHGGIGVNVDGDGSGATLVVRVKTPGMGRDFAVPINFTGNKWIEIPHCEQGWRLRNWNWCPHTKKFCDLSNVVEISVGLGYLPANTSATITINKLYALEEILEPAENISINVGGHSISFPESVINTYNHFTLFSGGDFTVYDENWNVLSVETAVEFSPESLETFAFESSSSSSLWVEACVQASNESKELFSCEN